MNLLASLCFNLGFPSDFGHHFFVTVVMSTPFNPDLTSYLKFFGCSSLQEGYFKKIRGTW